MWRAGEKKVEEGRRARKGMGKEGGVRKWRKDGGGERGGGVTQMSGGPVCGVEALRFENRTNTKIQRKVFVARVFLPFFCATVWCSQF